MHSRRVKVRYKIPPPPHFFIRISGCFSTSIKFLFAFVPHYSCGNAIGIFLFQMKNMLQPGIVFSHPAAKNFELSQYFPDHTHLRKFTPHHLSIWISFSIYICPLPPPLVIKMLRTKPCPFFATGCQLQSSSEECLQDSHLCKTSSSFMFQQMQCFLCQSKCLGEIKEEPLKVQGKRSSCEMLHKFSF